jgi:transposase
MRKQILRTDDTLKKQMYQLSLPMDVRVMIEANSSVRTMLEITERMDYSRLNASYDRLPHATEVSPKEMFQLTVLGFMEGKQTTRALEDACRHDIRFMYIRGNKRVPDHNRFWSFIKHRLQGEVAEHLFYQLVEYLNEAGEINLANLFVDGTKIEACANKYSFVWAKATGKNEARLDVKLAGLVARLTNDYLEEIPSGTNAEKCCEILSGLASTKGIMFTSGRGKRKHPIQRDIEQLESLLLRKDKYTQYNATFRGRNSFSKTDPDATFMRMKEDHMRNGQLKPGYNLQLGVEGEYVVGVNISEERSDMQCLIPLLERMEKGMGGKRHENVIADAGYESEENYKALITRKQVAYIKPQNYEKSKTRKYKTNAYLRENMPYDPQTDMYTCPNGDLFIPICTTTRKSASGFKSEVTVYECQGCGSCPRKKDCTRAKGNRQIRISKEFLALRQASRERITSPHGTELRLNRSIQAEGVFGNMKQNYGFRRYLRRGKENVFTETLLYAIAYNINKYHQKQLKDKPENPQISLVTYHTAKVA